MKFSPEEKADLLEALELATSLGSDPEELDRWLNLTHRIEAQA